ncbi:entericidin A/B family lipoprotein [Magnetospirillum sp. UT-4]|uniref:entericidin A/B family lipoprotein n=1 Tax=Magnetospirillum sp. UT-4 TaxID=2681467 RepID=UPI0013819C4B|nr:entericidin A/B family lipoprotein [Magnetospirillum sp. UT-4]CAA7613977.1 entericidin A membrane lipoprotein, antidote entericidin B (modular protein) [Magnetospirillum sp. UT-4]
MIARKRAKAVAHRQAVPFAAPLAVLMLAAAILALPGCNTVSGVGEDIEAAGRGLDQTSESTQEKLDSDSQNPDGTYQAGQY